MAALATVLGVALVVARDSLPPARPNVLLVSIDSLRADHLGCYGYARATSPTLDQIAREGVLFRSAISASSWTLPSHVSLLTAMPPSLHRVIKSFDRLTPESVTLAEVLRAHGYATMAAVSGPFLRSVHGLDQGFDRYDESAAKVGLIESLRGTTSPQLVATVQRMLGDWKRRGDGRPFFLFLHMWDVHYDYAPPPPYSTMFDPDYRGTVTGENFSLDPKINARMDRRDLEHLIALYDGEIRFTDDHVALVLQELARLGVLDDTIVVVVSDHGDEFFEHGRKGHGQALYDETIHIPFLIRYPRRVPAGQVIEGQVRTIDVPATILGLAGISPPADFGTPGAAAYREADLTPWIRFAAVDAPFPWLIAFSQTAMGGDARRSIRTLTGKFIPRSERKRPAMAFDLTHDPGEKVNLIRAQGELPAFASPLKERGAEWRAHWQSLDHFSEPVHLDADQRARLSVLGYLQ